MKSLILHQLVFIGNAFHVTRTLQTSFERKATPSWEELATHVSTIKEEKGIITGDDRTPLVTLYRDTNGWCPFCERVWVCLHVKDIPYRERLIDLRDKPEWYKEIVPTTLVPALLFHETGNNTERKLVWESSKIIEALDEAFPDTKQLVFTTPEYKQAETQLGELSSAGFQFVYAARNATKEELLHKKETFLNKLEELDKALLANKDGPYRLGKEFTALDAILVPMMERWRYQLPITTGLDILEGRPGLQRWFQGMEDTPAYTDRVAGDQYSWTTVASYFLQFFGELSEDMKAAIQEASQQLETSFLQPLECCEVSSIKAAEIVISNHEAIIKDCTNPSPITQKELARATNEPSADIALRHVVSVLLSNSGDLEVEHVQDASLALRTIAKRLCVPRDMGAAPASALRSALFTVAQTLEQSTPAMSQTL